MKVETAADVYLRLIWCRLTQLIWKNAIKRVCFLVVIVDKKL